MKNKQPYVSGFVVILVVYWLVLASIKFYQKSTAITSCLGCEKTIHKWSQWDEFHSVEYQPTYFIRVMCNACWDRSRVTQRAAIAMRACKAWGFSERDQIVILQAILKTEQPVVIQVK